MFKGSPVSETLKKPSSRFPVTVSKIGTPQGLSPVGGGGKTPIADLYAAGVTGGVGTSGIVEGPDSPGWLRRVKKSFSLSLSLARSSLFSEKLTCNNLGNPSEY